MDEPDSNLARLYRRSSREEPPAQLDLAVMEMARRSIRRGGWAPFGDHRLAVGALAAVALVSVILVTVMKDPGRPPTKGAGALSVPDAGTVRLPLPTLKEQRARDAADADGRGAGTVREGPDRPAAQAGEGQTSPPGGTAPAERPLTAGPQQPRFDFYKTLPEMQVVVPPPAPDRGTDAAVSVEKAPVMPSPVPQTGPVPAVEAPAPSPEPVDSAGGFYLQAGAFRAADYAARFRERLEALGLPAGVEAIKLDNQETWHRVRIGPYRDPAAIAEVQARLKAQGIDSLRVRIDEHR